MQFVRFCNLIREKKTKETIVKSCRDILENNFKIQLRKN